MQALEKASRRFVSVKKAQRKDVGPSRPVARSSTNSVDMSSDAEDDGIEMAEKALDSDDDSDVEEDQEEEMPAGSHGLLSILEDSNKRGRQSQFVPSSTLVEYLMQEKGNSRRIVLQWNNRHHQVRPKQVRSIGFYTFKRTVLWYPNKLLFSLNELKHFLVLFIPTEQRNDE